MQTRVLNNTANALPDLVAQHVITVTEARHFQRQLTKALSTMASRSHVTRSPITIDITLDNDTDDVISVTVTSRYPRLSAITAQGILTDYMAQSVQQNRVSAGQAAAFIHDELNRVGDNLHQALHDLAVYQQQQHIANIDEALKDITDRSDAMQTALSTAVQGKKAAEVQVTTYAAELSNTEREVLASITSTQNPLLGSIDQEIETLDAQRSSTLQLYLPTSPEVQIINRQIADAQARRAHIVVTQIPSTTKSLNPVRQTIETDYLVAVSQVDAARVQLLTAAGKHGALAADRDLTG